MAKDIELSLAGFIDEIRLATQASVATALAVQGLTEAIQELILSNTELIDRLIADEAVDSEPKVAFLGSVRG